jgi:hypothetical protein
VEEGFGAEVGLILELGNNHRRSRRTIEALEYGVAEFSSGMVGIPACQATSGMNFMNNVRVHQHLKHPGDTFRAKDVNVPIGPLIKQCSLSI